MQIIPAILEPDFQSVISKIGLVNGLTSRIQIDVCDGEFGAKKTWIPNSKDVLPEGFSYEFDIMVNDWKIVTAQCLLLKATSIIAHVDTYSEENIEMLIAMIRPYNIRLGIAVSNDTSFKLYKAVLEKIKESYENIFAQVMGIRYIGKQGQPFDDEVLVRIREIKQAFPDIAIQVDGGVSTATISSLKYAGAESVVVGSAIFGSSDIRGAIEALKMVASH